MGEKCGKNVGRMWEECGKKIGVKWVGLKWVR